MLNELRERMAAFLALHQVCILSVATDDGVEALPVRYCSRGLEVDCLVPRWADAAYWLEVAPVVSLIIEGCHAAGLRWLACLGAVRPVDAPDWAALLPNWHVATPPDHIYRVFRVIPQRIDLFDESKGWGERETLEPD